MEIEGNRMLGWFHRLGSPKTFFGMSQSWPKTFGLLSLLLLAFGTVWGLLFAPPDYQQGHSVRIMYVHVPAAAVAQSCYLIMAISSAVFLIWNIKLADWAAKSMAPIGASLAFLVLITGAIWGKPTWGTWWAWDARITSMLILVLFYIMYLVAWRIYENNDKAFKITSIITILGIVNVPIIKYSVDWWNTLHQPASINIFSKSSIHISMMFPLMIMTASFALFSLLIFLMKYNTELIKIKNKGLDRL